MVLSSDLLRIAFSRGRLCASAPQTEAIMIYEMRVYRCVPGRLPALLKRFQDVTLKIWDKHGIKQAGFWTTLIGEFQSGADLSARLGVARGPREEVERLHGRS